MVYIYYVHLHPINHSDIDMCYLIYISRINHIVADMHILHLKVFSYIPYNMMKMYCNVK